MNVANPDATVRSEEIHLRLTKGLGSPNRGSQASNIGLRIMFNTSTRPRSRWNFVGVRHRTGLGIGAGVHLTARRPEFIHGLACMEFIWPMPAWSDFHGDAIETFQKFRTPGVGEEMILQNNLFIEGVLPGATVRKLSEKEMSAYRAPFLPPESRRPIWRFPNEIPIEGKPADVYATMEDAHRSLAQSTYSKLLFAGDPSALISPIVAKKFAKALKNCRFAQLRSGLHYLQKDHPDVIGVHIHQGMAHRDRNRFESKTEADVVSIALTHRRTSLDANFILSVANRWRCGSSEGGIS
jgi:hypothetical protein